MVDACITVNQSGIPNPTAADGNSDISVQVAISITGEGTAAEHQAHLSGEGKCSVATLYIVPQIALRMVWTCVMRWQTYACAVLGSLKFCCLSC